MEQRYCHEPARQPIQRQLGAIIEAEILIARLETSGSRRRRTTPSISRSRRKARKAALDAKMAVLETHLKAAIETGTAQRSYPPEARKAKDGHHYMPDSSRPGKYLLVVHHG